MLFEGQKMSESADSCLENEIWQKRLLISFQEDLGLSVDISFDGTTYVLESDEFEMSVQIDGEDLVILNFEVFNKAEGLGGKILGVIHEFADNYGLNVTARKVKEEAEGFWQKQGYLPGSEGENWYRTE